VRDHIAAATKIQDDAANCAYAYDDLNVAACSLRRTRAADLLAI